jgi:hypothetical protein
LSDQDTIAELLSDAVSAIIVLVESHGIGSDLPINRYQVMWMEPVDPNSSQSRIEELTEPSFHLLQFEQPMLHAQLYANPAVKKILSDAAGFVKQNGILGPMHFGSPESLAEQLLATYFNRVGSFAIDDQIAREVCTQYVEDLRTNTGVIASVFLVENFSASTPFNLSKEVRFRQIERDDIDRYGRIPFHPFIGRDQPWLDLKHWVCDVEQVSPKDTMVIFNGHGELAEQIAGALNLSTEGTAKFTLLANYWKSPFISSGTVAGGNPFPTSGVGNPVKLDPDGVKAFQSIYAGVQRIGTDSRLAHLKLPFRRLRLAASRASNEDRLVDHVIGLESLLASDSPYLETTFRFRLRGAALLPQSFGSPRERIDLMSKLYELRSSVVHGKAAPKEVDEFLPMSERILRSILLWSLNRAGAINTIRDVVRRLDEALVTGGSTWAYANDG